MSINNKLVESQLNSQEEYGWKFVIGFGFVWCKVKNKKLITFNTSAPLNVNNKTINEELSDGSFIFDELNEVENPF